MRLDKRITMPENECRVFTESKVITKKNLQKRLFLKFLLSGAQTVEWDQIWKHASKKALKELLKEAFPRRCSSSGSPAMCQFVEKCWNR